MLYQSVPGDMPGAPDFTWIIDPGIAGRVYPRDHFEVPAAAGSGPAARSTFSIFSRRFISWGGGFGALVWGAGCRSAWRESGTLDVVTISHSSYDSSESFSTTCVWWVARA